MRLYASSKGWPQDCDAVDEPLNGDLLQNGNHSNLSHGLEPMNAKAAARFLEYVGAMVNVPEARIGTEHATLRGL